MKIVQIGTNNGKDHVNNLPDFIKLNYSQYFYKDDTL